MGYWTWALIIMLINIGLVAFFLISYFKEIMEFMDENGYGKSSSNYDRYDNRGTWIIVAVIASVIISFLAWPVILMLWAVGFMYLYIKGEDKFKRIMAILKEKPGDNAVN